MKSQKDEQIDGRSTILKRFFHLSQKAPFLFCFLGLVGPPREIEFSSISESNFSARAFMDFTFSGCSEAKSFFQPDPWTGQSAGSLCSYLQDFLDLVEVELEVTDPDGLRHRLTMPIKKALSGMSLSLALQTLP